MALTPQTQPLETAPAQPITVPAICNPDSPWYDPFQCGLFSSGGGVDVCDPSSPWYDPASCEQNTSAGGSSSGGGSNVNVNVTTVVNLANNIGQALASAIADAMNSAADRATEIANNTATSISNSMSAVVGTLSGYANNLFGQIGAVFSNVVGFLKDNIGSIFNAIVSSLGNIASQIASAVANAIGPVLNAISQAVQVIQQINANFIQPITTLILQTLQTVGTLTTAIENDLHNGLQGILQLPADLANGLGSLDATIQRTMQQLGTYIDPTVRTTIGGTAADTIWTRLKDVGDGITSVTGYKDLKTTYTDSVKLPEPNIAQAGAAAVDAMWAEIMTVISSLFHGGTQTLDALKTGLPVLSTILGLTGEAPAMIVAIAGAAFAAAIPFFSFVRNDMQAKTGLEKLNPGDALRAWLRGFIDTPTLTDELAVHGWDAQRIQVMRDLENYLIDNQTAIDMWFRGIIESADLLANASAHGISPTDLSALQGAAYKLFPVELASTALRFGILTDEEHTVVLKENRYTDNQIAAFKAVLYRPESTAQVINRFRVEALYSGLGFTDPNFYNAPDEVFKAAQAAGDNARVAIDEWQASYMVFPVQVWIELYFRGYRTLKELHAAFDYYKVPAQLRNDLIQVHQALIPWRTIPTMLANGIISKTYAQQQLQAHGFDLTATEALLKYATITKAKAAAVVLGDPFHTSLSAAKELWSVGAFSDLQYEVALQGHGFTHIQAQTIVNADKFAAEVRDRKQLAQDIVNEVLAGLISEDDAKKQMAQHQFTLQETARVLKSIAKTQRATTKTPAETELKKMVDHAAITFADWQSTMGVLGYMKKWIDAYAVINWGSVNGPSAIVGTASSNVRVSAK